MPLTPEQLNERLLRENCDEAAYLFGQRERLLASAETTWQTLARCERRLNEHIDALVPLPGPAVCEQLLKEEPGEAGPAFVHGCTLLLQGALDALASRLSEKCDAVKAAYLAALDYVSLDPHRVAICRRLKEAAPVSWLPIARALLAQRQLPPELGLTLITRWSSHEDPDVLIRLAWMAGRIQAVALLPWLHDLFARSRDRLRFEAGFSLLLLGATYPFGPVDVEQDGLLIGLAGAARYKSALQEQCLADPACPEAVLGLGLLGDPGSFPVLQAALARPSLARDAALALYLLTGVRIDKGVPEAEEQEYEAAAVAALRAVCAELDPGGRYLLGKPISPQTLRAELVQSPGPSRSRGLLRDKLCILEGHDRCLPERPADQQTSPLAKLSPRGASWAARLAAS